MSSPHLPSRVSEIVVCPLCRAGLQLQTDSIQCCGCGESFSLQDGVPIFLPGRVENALDHTSNPIGSKFETLLRAGEDFILHNGAGGTPARFPNCVEFEHKIFRHTDVVGDAHRLPFRDSIFDRVFAFNVFEHLREPTTAAREIQRVLKPGGVATIHTAFLQPLHEEPNHFYNATAYGVREWFSSFEIEECNVSGNFGPGVMLAFLSASVLDAARNGGAAPEEQMVISGTTLKEWADVWRHRSNPPPAFHILQNLPQIAQCPVAAGFELTARKPSEDG